ncbi:hypothetical protein Apa02nite_075490 [Actinoplanes palleronii]|uniref:Uncharacterized protein n=1 Tax=Actinoplanes palleronii TaxID=113570 RepID=A0ABQ4BMA5_9ACTN|nr:hypothetical protein Apa02nite_075490 [Actinoplanes palleronii]
MATLTDRLLRSRGIVEADGFGLPPGRRVPAHDGFGFPPGRRVAGPFAGRVGVALPAGFRPMDHEGYEFSGRPPGARANALPVPCG